MFLPFKNKTYFITKVILVFLVFTLVNSLITKNLIIQHASAQTAQKKQDTELPDNKAEEEETVSIVQNSSDFPDGKAELILKASLKKESDILTHGVTWRIYKNAPQLDNKLPLASVSKSGQSRFVLKPGNYIILGSFGHATKTKEIEIEANHSYNEFFNFNAGGLRLTAKNIDGQINLKQLRFAIFDQGDTSAQAPLIKNIKPNEIVRLPAGQYHIVAYYGKANAVSRSDIRVVADRLLDVTMQQHAAQVILKLVREEGGEAIADTSWAIMNYSGDVVKEIANANAYIILAEGDYVAIARNKDQVYQKDFSVTSGEDQEIEVVASQQNAIDTESID